MGKLLIEMIGNLLPLTGKPILDFVIISSAAVISYALSSVLVRILIIYGSSSSRKNSYWVARVVIFTVLLVCCRAIYLFVVWILGLSTFWKLICGLVSVIVIVSIIYLIHLVGKKREASLEKTKHVHENKSVVCTSELAEKTSVGNSVNSETVICELCGEEMVKRTGPYGFFYGCSQYPKCRKTRSVTPRE